MRIRSLHKQAEKAAHAQDEAKPAAELPAYLRDHLTKQGGSVAASAAVPAVALTQNTVKALSSNNTFLTHAAEKSRAAGIARKRMSIAASEAVKVLAGGPVAAANTKTRYPVVYRYQEGFTNAVRRTVKLSDLL